MGVLARLHPDLRFNGEMATLFGRLRRRFEEVAAPAGHGVEGTGAGAPVGATGRPSLQARRGDAAHRTPGSAAPLQAREGDAEGRDEAEKAPTLSLCYLALLGSSLSREALHAFVERLRIPQSDAHLLREVVRLRESLAELRSPVMLPSGIHRLLHPYSREARFVLSVLTDSERVRQRLDLYEREWSAVRPTIDGHTLRSLGVPPGPVYGRSWRGCATRSSTARSPPARGSWSWPGAWCAACTARPTARRCGPCRCHSAAEGVARRPSPW